TDLDALPGKVSSFAEAINATGHAVGSSDRLAFLWSPYEPNGTAGRMTSLGTLGGATSVAHAINTPAQVVGAPANSDGLPRGFLWDPATGEMTTLGPLGEGTKSGAFAVNDVGQVTGESFTTPTGDVRTFLYSDGQMVEIGSAPPATLSGPSPTP